LLPRFLPETPYQRRAARSLRSLARMFL
jgi:hypothetical protein